MEYNMLIVDDDTHVASSLSLFFQEDYHVFSALSIKDARVLFSKHCFHVILLDLKLKDGSGLLLLPEIKKQNSLAEVIVITVLNDVKTAVEAIKSGAFEYITKPYELSHIGLIVRQALDKIISKNLFQCVGAFDPTRPSLIGNSVLIENIRTTIHKISCNKATILITGESGVGKEIVARAIHDSGNYKNKPFVAVHMGAISEGIIESELFGHEKGSFTGAQYRKIGSFELAHGGTIFLDEISTMNMNTQIKLLRVLQEREFTRVGGFESVKIDVRVIAATNSNLRHEVLEGLFRQDLFFRLNVVNIEVPPLRNRKEDIPLLCEYYVKHFSDEFQKKVTEVSKEATEVLLSYAWPGNIRELKNVIESCVALSDSDCISLNELPMYLFVSQKNSPCVRNNVLSDKKNHFYMMEKEILIQALNDNNWNQVKTAEKLGIHRNTLFYKLKKFNIRKGSMHEGSI